ncbi:hypothetical protein B0H19DRAFT_1158745 [Mycena capillaripes]|nr:hypothetical protein B0H19DRAFT_1158745 [Mycena capillaripes]
MPTGMAGMRAAQTAPRESSPFFRNTHPALHARLFLARAQAEIRARGLDTCGSQLSARMVDASTMWCPTVRGLVRSLSLLPSSTFTSLYFISY